MDRPAAGQRGCRVNPAARLRRAAQPAVRRVRAFRRRRALREAVAAIRRARGVRLVLVYHRVAPRDEPRYEVIPTVPTSLFPRQLTAFGEVADFEPLGSLLSDDADPGRPLRLALTFDDDYSTHVRHALPVLHDLGLHATFFLSGRDIHGLGGYWFQRLEALLAERGLAATAALLDAPADSEPRLARHCEGDARRLALIDEHAPLGEQPLDGEGIRALAAAGMGVGFHTLHHPVLTTVDDDTARDALTAGRERLAAVVGEPLEWFAYPHGKADDRIVELTRQAGYRAAWTTQPRVLHAADAPFLFGRWEPLPMGVDETLIRLGAVLGRGARG